jgi:hypothetical protein
MATDNGAPAAVAVKKQTDREKIISANEDKSNWEWVEIPATDIFDQRHCGVSINFSFFQPEIVDGNYTGKPGRYFVDPETASEVRRLLANKMKADIRVLQPRRDQVAIDIMNRNGARIGGSVI